jgi:hypothetical protein
MKGVTTGTIKKELDFELLNIAACIVGVYGISELINHINTPSDKKNLIICPILEFFGTCQYGWVKNMCPKMCGGGESSSEDSSGEEGSGEEGGGALGPDDY